MAQWTFAFWGSEMGALEWGVGYDQSWWWRHYNDVNDVVLVSLLFALDMFRATVWCFRFWLWACRHFLDIIWCKHIFLHFYSSSAFGKSWAVGWLVLWTEYYKKNIAKAPQTDLMLKIDTLKISYVFTYILVLILSSFLAIKSIFLKMLKQILSESFISTFVS